MKERLIIAGLIVGGAAGLLAATAGSTPGSGSAGFPSAVTAVQGDLDEPMHLNLGDIKFQTKDGVDFASQTIKYAPGAFSGWHRHPGVVLVIVTQGQFTRDMADCTSEVYNAGDAFVENYSEPAMNLRNSGIGDAILSATWVLPDGATRREDVTPAPPACP